MGTVGTLSTAGVLYKTVTRPRMLLGSCPVRKLHNNLIGFTDQRDNKSIVYYTITWSSPPDDITWDASMAVSSTTHNTVETCSEIIIIICICDVTQYWHLVVERATVAMRVRVTHVDVKGISGANPT